MSHRTEIAQTILKQLGGRRFMVMTGAKDLVSIEKGLRFRIPGYWSNLCKGKVNCVTVTLTDADLYDVTYQRIHGTKVTTMAESHGLYADMLEEDFTEKTGLDTRL